MSNGSETSHSRSNTVRRGARRLVAGVGFYAAYTGLVLLWAIFVVAYTALQFLDQKDWSIICGGDGAVARGMLAAAALLVCLATLLFASQSKMHPDLCRKKVESLCQSKPDLEDVLIEADGARTGNGAKVVLSVATVLAAIAVVLYPAMFKFAGVSNNNLYSRVGEVLALVLAISALLALTLVAVKTDRAASVMWAARDIAAQPGPQPDSKLLSGNQGVSVTEEGSMREDESLLLFS
ncbi:hypothetical protein [Neorickettsia sennetsu]|uniref:Transmembrane protein n=1 Tax=Ehrlichia sennetsu (strain ATCC VR-367 / Miyayama) TaxID=222891 RepID=Q2GEW7_EHRS3|nr:hypothetical protein [Neorickettsia sennetsu]ABD46087.1 hypothetical protein NSE_0078 [Neorickettsia sennetsu str. Miyayama]